jgi:hypothetical protein
MDKEQLASELSRSETLSQFWDRAHQAEHPYWLSGSAGSDIWRRLAVTDLVRNGATVLNIGVGLGHCTRALVPRVVHNAG